MRLQFSSSRLRSLLVAILIAALVSSYWQGLAHRIGHASRMMAGIDSVQMSEDAQPDSAETPSPLSSDHQGAGHNCLAFDAATVGAFMCTAPYVIDVPRHAPVMAVWIAFISYLAPFTAHFSSRAPPQS
jgi:hypothetical protein